MAKEQFFHPESADLLKTLDEAADRSGLSRGQAFDDFLNMVVCSLSGGRMEEQYLEVVKRHSRGKPGKRGCDSLAELFGRTVAAMEETRDEMKDILGDLFQGGITYGQAGQFFTPENVCRMMSRMMVNDVPEEEQHETKRVCDPASGSGRMLLAVAEIQPHWLFVGRDIDLRCVRMTAINLALRNLFGFVIWGNSLADERRLVYRTGFDLKGFISEVSLGDLPEPVQRIATKPILPLTEGSLISVPLPEPHTTPTDDRGEWSPRRMNQLRLF